MKNLKFKSYFSAVFWIVGVFAIRSSFADQYVIPSGSMEPTIQIGDHVLVDKRAYDFRLPFTDISLLRTGEPRRGDVVVFKDPRNPSICLIKRLVGVPGDHILVHGDFIRVNGAPDLPPQGGNVATRSVYGDQDLIVPQGKYFFLGDNRNNSADSREWGFASRSALLGRAQTVLYSLRWESILPILNPSRSGTRL